MLAQTEGSHHAHRNLIAKPLHQENSWTAPRLASWSWGRVRLLLLFPGCISVRGKAVFKPPNRNLQLVPFPPRRLQKSIAPLKQKDTVQPTAPRGYRCIPGDFGGSNVSNKKKTNKNSEECINLTEFQTCGGKCSRGKEHVWCLYTSQCPGPSSEEPLLPSCPVAVSRWVRHLCLFPTWLSPSHTPGYVLSTTYSLWPGVG